MRIAYLIWSDLSREQGIPKKFLRQLKAWAELGHEPRLFGFTPGPRMWSELRGYEGKVLSVRSPWRRMWTAPQLFESVLAWNPDCVYFRFGAYYPGLARLMGHVPTVAEVNGELRREMAANGHYAQVFYDLATRWRMRRGLQGAIFVAEDIKKRTSLSPHVPRAVLGNTIDLANYPQLDAPKNERPRLVFLGNLTRKRHGYPEIIQLAHSNPDWHFDLIGELPTDPSAAVPPANVLMHGQLSQDQYEPLLQQADVALGSLSIHRIRRTNNSALKTLEYLAYGIPTVLGYQETDLPSHSPYLLCLPSEPGNVMRYLSRIRQFVHQAWGKRVPRHFIAHLDTTEKERRRIDLIKEWSQL